MICFKCLFNFNYFYYGRDGREVHLVYLNPYPRTFSFVSNSTTSLIVRIHFIKFWIFFVWTHKTFCRDKWSCVTHWHLGAQKRCKGEFNCNYTTLASLCLFDVFLLPKLWPKTLGHHLSYEEPRSLRIFWKMSVPGILIYKHKHMHTCLCAFCQMGECAQ